MMSSRNPNANRISNLPDNVIDIILTRLPLRDAARTSLVSTEWRYKWISIPDLVFDRSFDKAVLQPLYQVEKIIYQVLLHHQGTITKFALQVPSSITSLDVDQWIRFLSNHQVHDFTLHFRGGVYTMPSRFFEFHHLRHLSLYLCEFRPRGFKGFSRLVSLDCRKVCFPSGIFGQFVSQCTQLEKVRAVACFGLDNIEVQGPNLRSFTLYGLFRSIRFKNCLVLAEVSLAVNEGKMCSPSHFKKYFDFVPTLEKLYLNPRVLECLEAGGAPNQLPSSLNRLRVLHLSMYLDIIEEVSFALCLIRSSPNLQMLRIYFNASRIVDAVVEFIRVQETPDCRMDQLKKVAITRFSGTETQMEFAAYLLAVAGALEEMVISISRSSRDGGLGLMNKLRQLPRASGDARLIFNQ